MRKVNLKAQLAFGHISEMEFAQSIRGSGLQPFTIPQKVKPGAGNEILTGLRKDLTQNLCLFSFTTNLDMNIEIFRVQNEVPRRTGSSSSACQHRPAETIEHDSGEYAADVRTTFA